MRVPKSRRVHSPIGTLARWHAALQNLRRRRPLPTRPLSGRKPRSLGQKRNLDGWGRRQDDARPDMARVRVNLRALEKDARVSQMQLGQLALGVADSRAMRRVSKDVTSATAQKARSRPEVTPEKARCGPGPLPGFRAPVPRKDGARVGPKPREPSPTTNLARSLAPTLSLLWAKSHTRSHGSDKPPSHARTRPRCPPARPPTWRARHRFPSLRAPTTACS